MGRTGTLLTAAATAMVPTLSHAALVTNPTFNCSSDLAVPSTLTSINWGDFTSNSSIIIVTATGGETAGPAMGCAAGIPSAFVSGGDSFTIDFTPPSSAQWLGGAKMTEKDFTEDIGDAKYEVALFDAYLPYSPGLIAVKETDENFLGISFKWLYGDKQPGPIGFSVDTAGNLVLDPAIPENGVTVSFYSTPQVPEPGSLLLLGAGMAGLGALWRKKRR